MQLSVMLAPECELIARAVAYLSPLNCHLHGVFTGPCCWSTTGHFRCAQAPVEPYLVHHAGSLHDLH